MPINEQLAGVGPAFLDDGGRLAPDKLCSPGSETAIAAKGELIGLPVQRAVTTFHRLNAQGITGAKWPDSDGAKEWAQVVAETDRKIEPPALVFKLLQGVEFEIAGQGS